MMTRKNFSAIAKAINDSTDRSSDINRALLIKSLIDYFRTVNPSFEPTKFRTECDE